jgi:hypothetical protein
MSANKLKRRLTRTEAVQELTHILQQLKDGRVSLNGKASRLPASDQLEFAAVLEDDRLRVELTWDT